MARKAGAEVMARVEVMASAEIEWDQAERMQAEWLAARVGVKSRQLGMRSIPWRRQYIQRVGAQHVRYARRLPLDGVSVELQLTPQLESARRRSWSAVRGECTHVSSEYGHGRHARLF